jgi:hypothetical protein
MLELSNFKRVPKTALKSLGGRLKYGLLDQSDAHGNLKLFVGNLICRSGGFVDDK